MTKADFRAIVYSALPALPTFLFFNPTRAGPKALLQRQSAPAAPRKDKMRLPPPPHLHHHRSQLAAGIILALLILFLPGASLAQTSDVEEEMVLGLQFRNSILSRAPVVSGTKEDAIGQRVFGRLIATRVAGYGPAFQYRLTLLGSRVINAFSTPGGQVYVPEGMAELLGDNEGMWAAVLGHELGHGVGRHYYRAYVRAYNLQQQAEYYRRRAAAGDASANWALLGLAVAGGLTNLKMSRDDEHEADKLGIMMMAEAGYHPAYAISLYRKLKARVGDQSKVAAFFSDHPRWTTREQRALKLYDDALAVFESRWPDAAASPGGTPPVLATVGPVKASKEKQEKAAVIQIPYMIRNAKGARVAAVVLFMLKGKRVAGALPAFRDRDGQLVASSVVEVNGANESGSVVVKIPAAALEGGSRKLKAVAGLVGEGEVLDIGKEFSVEIPKP